MRDFSSYALRILKSISFPRLAGTNGEDNAREIITSELRKLNLPIREESFSLWTFKPGDGYVEVGNRKFKAIPYGNSKPFTVEGPICFVDNVDFIGNEIKDKIVLVYQGLRGSQYEKLLEKGAKGLISVSLPERGFNFVSISQRFVEEGKIIPALIVDYDTGLLLRRNESRVVKLHGSTSYFKGNATNIIVEIKGETNPEEIVIVCGHYDSVAISPGATDNAGGSAILLALAKYYSRFRLPRTMRLIWFSGEELGLLGSQAYVENIKEEIKKVKFVLNLDVAGDPLGENRAVCISEKDVLSYISILSKEVGIPFKAELGIYSSDSMPFAIYGVPSVNLFRIGGKGTFYIHSHSDKKAFVDKDGVRPVLDFSIYLIDRLQRSKFFPFERKISTELKEKIIDYFQRMQGRKIELKWE
ncbi:MAG: M28 family metallopeptidase [candidate division WOR-3 bacterium]